MNLNEELTLTPEQSAAVDAATEFAENLSSVVREAALTKVDKDFIIDSLCDYIGILLNATPASSQYRKARLNHIRTRIQKPALSAV